MNTIKENKYYRISKVDDRFKKKDVYKVLNDAFAKVALKLFHEFLLIHHLMK